jgi:lambda family phage portal protein
MNWLDSLIGIVNPQAALRREMSRQQMAAIRASHRGGISVRTATPWTARGSYIGGLAADRDNAGHRRDRARKVFTEHPIARSLLKTETDNVVGQGFKLQSKSGSREFDREAEERFENWLNLADIRGMKTGTDFQRMLYQSPRRDGDGGVVLVDQGGSSRLQFIPGDLISTPDGKWGDATIKHGVEINPVGRPVAFHVLTQDEHGKRQWQRVAADNFIYLVPEMDDDLAVRGDSCYSSIFGLLDAIDGYIDAVVIAARMAAVFGLVFKEGNAGKKAASLSQTAMDSQGETRAALTLENGMLRYIGRDDEVVQVEAQQPLSQTPDFIRAIMRLLGLPFDMPLELIAKDMSQVNFASARIGLLGYYRACRARQRSFSTRCLSRVYRWWISRERKWAAAGLPNAFVTPFPETFQRHRFVSEGWDYTDPVSEVQGDILQIDAGLKTATAAAAERGRDWEEMQVEREAERAIQRMLNLPSVMSTMTRDGKNDDPIEVGGEPAREPLNGAQITAAIDVMARAREGALSDAAAIELLTQVGIDRARAVEMVSSLAKLTTGSGDVAFKREILKTLLTVPAAREAVYNGTDIEDLILQTGLNAEAGYEAPYIPVVAPTGPLVSGDTITDPQGDVVGGAVTEPEAEEPSHN